MKPFFVPAKLTQSVIWLLLGCSLVPAFFFPVLAQVYHEKLEPHWNKPRDRFWFRQDGPDATRRFWVVDPKKKEKQEAFSHQTVALALSRDLQSEIAPDKLPIHSVEYLENGTVILLGKSLAWMIDPHSGEVRLRDQASSLTVLKDDFSPSRHEGDETGIRFVNEFDADLELFWIDRLGKLISYGKLTKGETRQQPTYAGHNWVVKTTAGLPLCTVRGTRAETTAVINQKNLPRINQKPAEKSKTQTSPQSPDQRWEVLVSDHNLVLRGKDGTITTLTKDATAENTFDRALARQRLDGTDSNHPQGRAEVYWSPDSRSFVAIQTRRAPGNTVHLVESSPKDQVQPRLISFDYLKPGAALPQSVPRLFVCEGTEIREIQVTPIDIFSDAWNNSRWRWSADGKTFFFMHNARGHQNLRLIGISAGNGAAKVALEERSDTFIFYSSYFLCEWVSETEVLWMSERSGWNHLYLCDVVTGTVKNAITSGEWCVRRMVHLDPEKRTVWFEACGVRPGQDPYHTHFCRVNLDGNGFTVLTDGDGDQRVTWQPGDRWLIASHSRVDQPPVHELRDADDGSLVMILGSADASEIPGQRPFPERFTAKGRDGKTDIWGIIHFPKNFDPKKRYPIVENIYAGPHNFHVPKSFRARFGNQERIADLGCIVVQIDGMGTAGRSKAFHDVAWRNLKDAGFPDRIAWIKAAAETRPWMNLARVGIYGGSAGGQNAMAALLWHGDFYRAAVADCGCHDNRMDKIWWNEQWLGKMGPHYAENSNITHADRLQGKLLLIVGELDRNVDPASTLQAVDALVQAGKDFEMLILPGAGHGAAETPYGSRRRAEFLHRVLEMDSLDRLEH